MTPAQAALVVALSVLAAVPWLARPPAPTGGAPSARAGRRWPAAPSGVAPVVLLDPAVLLDLAAAALDAGASIPAALIALGEAAEGASGSALRRSGAALTLGAPWHEAWGHASSDLSAVADALEPAWTEGVPAGPLLVRAADHVRAERGRVAHEAAARLGARLVLPLGLCFLPAFVLLGLVPVLLATGSGLLG